MKVTELIELLQAAKVEDPEMQVLFTVDLDEFLSPCPAETGVIELEEVTDEDGEPISHEEMPCNKFFMIAPHFNKESPSIAEHDTNQSDTDLG